MRDRYQDVFSVFAPIAVAVVVIVFGIVGWCLWRFRRRDDRLPRGRTDRPLLEGAYLLVLTAVAAVLITVTVRAGDATGQAAQRVDVTAYRWGWRFAYAGTGVVVDGDQVRPPTLVVPADEPVGFTLTSRDVNHAFWVPDARFKRDAFPGRTTRFTLDFEAGEHFGECAEFCGLEHARMGFTLRALAPADFHAWLAGQEAS